MRGGKLHDTEAHRIGYNVSAGGLPHASGEPDALDTMVAISFASLATDLVMKNQFGTMVALREGKYTVVPIETISQGRKTVDIDELYDPQNYRPKVAHILNKPMFLY